MWTNSFLHFSVNYYSCYLFCCPFVWPLSAAHASWLLYHFLHDPIIFWVLQCFLAQNVLESSWTFSSWELEAISPRSQEALRSGAKRYYCSQAFSVDTHTDGLLSPLQHRLPMWTCSSSCLTFTPLTGLIPTATPHVPMANELLTSQTQGRRSTLMPFLSEVKEQSSQRTALQGVWLGAGGEVHSFPRQDDVTFPNCRVEDSLWLSDHSGVTRCQRTFPSLWHTRHTGLMTFIICLQVMSPWRLTREPHRGGHTSESPDLGLSSEVDGFGTSSFGQKWVCWCPAV